MLHLFLTQVNVLVVDSVHELWIIVSPKHILLKLALDVIVIVLNVLSVDGDVVVLLHVG